MGLAFSIGKPIGNGWAVVDKREMTLLLGEQRRFNVFPQGSDKCYALKHFEKDYIEKIYFFRGKTFQVPRRDFHWSMYDRGIRIEWNISLGRKWFWNPHWSSNTRIFCDRSQWNVCSSFQVTSINLLSLHFGFVYPIRSGVREMHRSPLWTDERFSPSRQILRRRNLFLVIFHFDGFRWISIESTWFLAIWLDEIFVGVVVVIWEDKTIVLDVRDVFFISSWIVFVLVEESCWGDRWRKWR